MNISIAEGDRIKFRYTNYRGVTTERTVKVMSIEYGTTNWHPDPGFLMEASDLEKDEYRLFAMKDMSEVRHV